MSHARVFGGTLALQGAITEAKLPHCEDGCFGCEMDGFFIFESWLEYATAEQARSAVHEHVRFDSAPRIP